MKAPSTPCCRPWRDTGNFTPASTSACTGYFRRDVPREVLSHHLDIGVISYIPEENELSAVEFYRDNLTVVVWPGHRLAKRREVDITDLGEETFIGHIVESPHRQRVVQLFARHHVPLHMDIEMPTIESIKLFVEMKKGVAIVPRMCVGPGNRTRIAAGIADAADADSKAALSRFIGRTGRSPPRPRRWLISCSENRQAKLRTPNGFLQHREVPLKKEYPSNAPARRYSCEKPYAHGLRDRRSEACSPGTPSP